MVISTLADSFVASSGGNDLLRPYEDEFFRLKRRFTPKTKKVAEKYEKDFEALRKAEEQRNRKKHKRVNVWKP